MENPALMSQPPFIDCVIEEIREESIRVKTADGQSLLLRLSKTDLARAVLNELLVSSSCEPTLKSTSN